jgi:hypothetical protein
MLIGLSGKIGSGKDTAADFIEEIISNDSTGFPIFKTIRFADKVKEIVALILGISINELEDRDFKNKPLGPDWTHWKVTTASGSVQLFDNQLSATLFSEASHNSILEISELTPRDLLILVGTESGRKLIHPNIWVNITKRECQSYLNKGYIVFVPDVRFENELDALESIGGIIIRINREVSDAIHSAKVNDSETSLDHYPFKWTIANTGSLNEFKQSIQTTWKLINEKTNQK